MEPQDSPRLGWLGQAVDIAEALAFVGAIVVIGIASARSGRPEAWFGVGAVLVIACLGGLRIWRGARRRTPR